MKTSTATEHNHCSNTVQQVTTAAQTALELPEYHSILNLPYIRKPILPGVDLHLEKSDLIAMYKLPKTLIHKKLDINDPDYDPDFAVPVYISPRKPVWLLSELNAWQEKLKENREMNNKTKRNTHE